MEDNSNLAVWVVIWVVLAGILATNRWRREVAGVGLPFAFLLNLWVNHWLAAVLYMLPWYLEYDLANDLNGISAGFQQTTYGLVGFVLGSIIVAPFLMRGLPFPRREAISHSFEPRLARAYTWLGIAFFIAKFLPIGRIATLSALVNAGSNSLLVGFCLFLWDAWQRGRHKAFLGWLLIALSFPLLTVVFTGFFSFGAMLFLSLFAFIMSFMRPRWKLIVLALCLAYLGISAYGTYKRDRDIIRGVIWDASASLEDRVVVVYDTFSSFEWFDPFNLLHLYLIDGRLNMNRQVGQAVEYMASGNAEPAAGSTLWWAVIGMIPRAIWTDKPVVAGGSDLVSQYTGIEFAEGTTVGIGLVMEFYVNYGTASVFLGFLLLGVILAAVDEAAGRRLSRGDWRGFAFWFLPGLAMVNPGANSVVEVTTSVGAAVVAAYLVNHFLLIYSKGRKVLPGRKRLTDGSRAQNGIPV